VDLNGKDPLVDSSSEWLQASSSSEHRRSTERHRKRRRARRGGGSAVRARIRLRMLLACTGALLAMAIVIYLAIGRERGGESGLGPAVGSGATVALDGAALRVVV
jgi:hypothetical protein